MIVSLTRKREHRDGPFAGRTEIYAPSLSKSGMFVLGDPGKGKVKHHAEHKVEVSSASEVVELLGKGFSLWMKGDLTRQRNLIAPQNIEGWQ